jgi:hypothetical protein
VGERAVITSDGWSLCWSQEDFGNDGAYIYHNANRRINLMVPEHRKLEK